MLCYSYIYDCFYNIIFKIKKIKHKLFIYIYIYIYHPQGQPIETPVTNSGFGLNLVICKFPITAFLANVKYTEIWDPQDRKCFMSVHNSDTLLSINYVQNLVSVNKLIS
jgi:hypothetical protein